MLRTLFAFAMLISPAMAAEPKTPDEQLAALFQKHLDSEFKRHPYFASQQGNREYDDRLDDLLEGKKNDLNEAKRWAKSLEELGEAKHTPAGKLDARIWMHALQSEIARAEMGLDRFDYDPRVFGEYISDSVFNILTQSTLPKERNVANAAKRIGFIPNAVAAAQDKAMLTKCPKILVEVAIKRNLGAIAFYEKDIFALTGENAATSELAKPCQAAVKSLKELQAFFEKDLLPRSTADWRIGKEKFAKKLRLDLDAGIEADEILKLAEAEAARVEREMYTVAKQLWGKTFPGVPLPPDDEAGRRECVRRVLEELAMDHGKPEELVNDAKKTVEKIRTFIREKKILSLPEPDRCRIIEMPEFQRGFSAAYLNPAPPLDPTAPSIYAISPPPAEWPEERRTAFLREYNRAMLQILTIHEAYPGHYVQLEYGNRNPSLIRKVLSSGVYAEGWAVYTEQMMLDQGYGEGDLSLRLHQLKFYLRAVLNAILDNKMHCENMTDDDAMKMLTGRGFQTEGEAFGKVQRAKQSSCQLSTYFVGRNAFYTLRQAVQRRDGDKFDLAAFHEKVLNVGTISVKYLPELLGVGK